MDLSLLPTLAIEGSAAMLEQGLTMSEDINAIYDLQWQQIFTTVASEGGFSLYGLLVDLARVFAVGALVIFMMRFVYAIVHEGDYQEPVRMLIWPLVVVLFLSDDGQLLAAGTRALRAELNDVASGVLEVTALNINLEQAVRGALAKGVIGVETSAQIQQCQTLIGESQIECLESAYQQIEATIGAFEENWIVDAAGNIAGSIPFLAQTRSAIEGAVEAYNTSGGDVGQVLPGFFGGFVGSQTRAIIFSLLTAFQWGFVNLIQISMLLTGLVAPIALAASLLPFGGKPIFAWLTGFFSLGFVQIMYNIIVGFAAVVIVNANTFDTNGYLVLISVLAPALAIALASGGGLAIFSILLSSSAGAVTLLVSSVSRTPAPPVNSSPTQTYR
ncbi:hypothetical protein [Halomicronema sp. CCY15110]|uniref:hypothetical protein n=1 Tax=Halomicronema sp. CCY15110 TaxID=2767773 RepID=UPI0019502F8D|nr:hypothetical protein [Halomicronema sp. CCY15110]